MAISYDDINKTEIIVYKGGVWTSSYENTWLKSVTIESPSAIEKIPLFFTEYGLTVSKIVSVLNGTTSPSVTWTLKHALDITDTGTEVVTGGIITTSTTTGTIVTSIDSPLIPVNSHIWFESSAITGNINYINLSLFYTIS